MLKRIVKHIKDRLQRKVPAHADARSSKWGPVRRAHLEEHATCAACGSLELPECHHVQPFHLHPALELDPKNLITLCERKSHNCHLVFGHLGNFQSWNPDVREDAARMLKKIENRPAPQHKKAA